MPVISFPYLLLSSNMGLSKCESKFLILISVGMFVCLSCFFRFQQFLEKKQTELVNTGHKMDDETFITHLLNSLLQSEYEGAILVIKDMPKKVKVELHEIEQILEDKYQEMKQIKGWDEEEDDYGLFKSQSNKKKPKKAFK